MNGAGPENMRELVRTNDAVLITAIEALLNGAQIEHMVVDRNMSVLEGSIGIFPRRMLVADGQVDDARLLLEQAGFAGESCRDGAEQRMSARTRCWAAGLVCSSRAAATGSAMMRFCLRRRARRSRRAPGRARRRRRRRRPRGRAPR